MSKSSITIDVDSSIKKSLEKRAEKELMSLRELISDILRRSVLSSKLRVAEKKTDDVFINIFSKSKKGRKKKRD